MRKKIILLATLNCSLILIIIGLLVFIQSKEARNSANHIKETAIPSVSSNKNEDSSEDSNISQETVDTKTDINANLNTSNKGKDITGDESDSPIHLVFAGDFYLSEYIQGQYDKKGINGVLSKELLKTFQDADLAMVNEEFPFSSKGTPMKDKQFTFRVSPKYVSLFQDTGIDVVTLANNHVLDYGEQALLDSISTLRAESIQYVGAGSNINEASEYKEFKVHNKKIAIIGASRVIPVADWNATNSKPGLLTTYDPTTTINQIKKAKETNDYVIIYVHWGIERHEKPEEYQRALAKQYIDAGADVVIGSHPHVLQGIEYYNGKPIIYSLGNFMFYNTIKQTALLQIDIDSKDQLSVSLIPCKAENAKTSELDRTQWKKFYEYITSISYGISINEDGVVTNE